MILAVCISERVSVRNPLIPLPLSELNMHARQTILVTVLEPVTVFIEPGKVANASQSRGLPITPFGKRILNRHAIQRTRWATR